MLTKFYLKLYSTETLNVKKETAYVLFTYNNLVFVNGMKNDDKCP